MKLLNPKTTLVLLLFFAHYFSNARLDPKVDLAAPEFKADTLNATIINNEIPDSASYNDAYDRQLRILQRKHRNWFQLKAGIAITQTSFSNWAAGGSNTFSGRAFLNAEHKYTKPEFNLKSTFDAAFGLVSTDGKVIKSEDYFNFSSSPSWRLSDRWDLTGSLVFRSQFANSYKTTKVAGADVDEFTSTFFAPAYLTLAAGFTYTNKAKTIEFYFAPISGELRMILNQEIADKGTFGEKGRQFIPKFINYTRFKYEEKMYGEKLELKFKLENFWDYNKVPRVIGEGMVNYKLTQLLNVSFFARGIYDREVVTPDTGNHLQLTETFGIGISYEILGKQHPAPPEAPHKRKTRNK